MGDSQQRAKGKAAFEQVMRFKPPPFPEGDRFLDTTFDHLFAEVWSDPALPVRDRRLVTLTVLMCLGHEATLKLHLGAAMRSGDLSDEAIDALIVHVAHYAGWPPAAIASQVVRQLRAERSGGGPA